MSRMLTLRIQNVIWCQSDQQCFAHIFLTFGMLYNCYHDGTFSEPTEHTTSQGSTVIQIFKLLVNEKE